MNIPVACLVAALVLLALPALCRIAGAVLGLATGALFLVVLAVASALHAVTRGPAPPWGRRRRYETRRAV